MKLNIVRITAGVLLLSLTSITLLNFNDNRDDAVDVQTRSTDVLQDIHADITEVVSLNPNSSHGQNSSQPMGDWLDIARRCHNEMRAAGARYSLGGFVKPDGSTTVRTDCSGYVSYALYKAGYTPDMKTGWSTSTMLAELSNYGWQELPTGSAPQNGDIFIWDAAHGCCAHTQILVDATRISTGMDGWYNWGSNGTLDRVYSGVSGQECFTVNPVSGVQAARSLTDSTCHIFRRK